MSKTRLALLGMLAIAAVAGVVPAFELSRSSEHWAMWTFHVLMLVSVFAWYVADSDARGFVRTRWLSLGIIFLMLFAFPYYLFKSRDTRGGFLALSKCISFVVLFYGVLFGSAMATYYFVGD